MKGWRYVLIYLGEKEIKEIFLCGKQIEAAYLGDKLVFQGKTLYILLRQMMLGLNEDDHVSVLVTFDQDLGDCGSDSSFAVNDDAKLSLLFADINSMIGTADMQGVDVVSVCRLNALDTSMRRSADMRELPECLAVHIVIKKADIPAEIKMAEVCNTLATLEQARDVKSLKPIDLTDDSRITAALISVTAAKHPDNMSVSEDEKSSVMLLVVKSVDAIYSVRLFDNSDIKGSLIMVSPKSIFGIWQIICKEAVKSTVLSVDNHLIGAQADFFGDDDIKISRLLMQSESINAGSTFLSSEEPYSTFVNSQEEQITANTEFSADVFHKICLFQPCLLTMTLSAEMKCEPKIRVQPIYEVQPDLTANIGISCTNSVIVEVSDTANENWEYPEYSEGTLKITQVRFAELDGSTLNITDKEK